MLQTLLTAITVYLSTSIDYLVILTILFAQKRYSIKKSHIYIGQYLGTAILVMVSLFLAYIVHFIPEEWMVGFLGFIPMIIGIKFLLVGEEDTEEEEVLEKIEHSQSLIALVVALTVASGGDNLGLYIPYFASLTVSQIILTITIFAIGIYFLVWISQKLADIANISETIEKYQKWIIPIVFTGLGLYILLENHTLQTLISLF